MAIEFSQLIEPTQLTTSLALVILGIMVILLYASFRLFSPVLTFLWAMTMTILILSFITSLSFIWFWLMVIIVCMSIPVISIIKYVLT